ncbi:MAG: pseudouridine synthase [Planctomycetota bacterium]
MIEAKRERLHKYIAACGYCSRRRAEILIANSLVQVNGKTVAELGAKITPGIDVVTIHGEKLQPPAPLTIALNKPQGYLTSTHDTHNRLTVMDLLPRKVVDAGILPAGRLDLESEGLLVLTNDGDLQHRITHPRYGCEKEYRVHLSRPPTHAERKRLENGLFLPVLNKRTTGAHLGRMQQARDGTAILRVTIHEGMKRQVRRMFEAVGIQVIYLERLAIGRLRLGDLPRGKWRPLAEGDITSLRSNAARPASRGKRTESQRDGKYDRGREAR